ncbi:hypothetical protein CCP1ISM_60038 [Azospirillaceae bacterium]
MINYNKEEFLYSQRKKDESSSIKKHLEPQLLSGVENVVDRCQYNEVNHADTYDKCSDCDEAWIKCDVCDLERRVR